MLITPQMQERFGQAWRAMAKEEGHERKFPAKMATDVRGRPTCSRAAAVREKIIAHLEAHPMSTAGEIQSAIGCDRGHLRIGIDNLVRNHVVKAHATRRVSGATYRYTLMEDEL